MTDLLTEIRQVVDTGNCSGCGGCTLIDPRLAMRLEGGFARPRLTRPELPPPRPPREMVREFRRTCPGKVMPARRWAGSTRHPLLGPVHGAWAAWAADPELRHRGSSGGVLSALAGWLAEGPEAPVVVASAAEPRRPARTVPVTITTKEEALAAAGSRYAPVSNAGHPAAVDPAAVFVGKPCEASAVRGLNDARGAPSPLVLSFFCAGTPSQDATDALVRQLGADPTAVTELWYRGRGWPGSFTVRTATEERSASYEDSWGQVLGRSLQWRCKICPDGVGESSDITAADLWEADERGYPAFVEGAGRSALLARTERGLRVVQEAFATGVIEGEPLDLDALVNVQPLQRSRRTTLAGRLLGTLSAGRRVPRYPGFGLIRLAVGEPRESWRTAKAAFRRVRAERPG